MGETWISCFLQALCGRVSAPCLSLVSHSSLSDQASADPCEVMSQPDPNYLVDLAGIREAVEFVPVLFQIGEQFADFRIYCCVPGEHQFTVEFLLPFSIRAR